MGMFFTLLVGGVAAVVQKVVTQTSADAPAPSATKPAGPAPTLFRTRPPWAKTLVLEFNPPVRGSVPNTATTGPPGELPHAAGLDAVLVQVLEGQDRLNHESSSRHSPVTPASGT
jgi:hypothetical protein